MGKCKVENRILVQMDLLIEVTAQYIKFLLWFMSESPLIHLLLTELKNLPVCILKRFVISHKIDGKSEKSLLQLDLVKEKEIHLPLEKIEVGEKTERLLKKLSIILVPLIKGKRRKRC